MYEARQNKEKVSRQIDKICTSKSVLRFQSNKKDAIPQNYIAGHQMPIFRHLLQNTIQCYAEIRSDANGTNKMINNSSDVYNKWSIISNQWDVLPLKEGLTPIYGLMRQSGTGIGPGSCNAVAEYCSPIRNTFYTAIGNSYAQQGGLHAERQAIQNVLEIADNFDNRPANPCNITRIYVELSPCPNCHDFLPGLVPNATVMYDYEYEDEKNIWLEYKKQEAKKAPSGKYAHLPHESGGSSYFDILMNPI